MNDEESKNVKEEIKKEKTTFCENVKLLREVCGLSKKRNGKDMRYRSK